MPSTLADMPLGAPPRTFQELIFALQKYWADQGCDERVRAICETQ